MPVMRWERDRATNVVDPLQVDELDGGVVVLDGVSADDDDQLRWCRRAPCVVIGCTDGGRRPAESVDIALVGEERERLLDGIVANVIAQPGACRTLVDVLRATPSLDVLAGLTLESTAYSMLLAGAEFVAWLAGQPPREPRTFALDPVRLDRVGDELRITLTRPENRNAFSAALRDELFHALTTAHVDPSIEHVVLAGAGPVFCSGGDLTEFGTASDVVRAHEIRTRRSVGAVLSGLPKTTAVVHGTCVGAGVEISAFADRVIADPGTTFRLPEISMGLVPGAGGTVSITRRIGRQHCARLAILGEPIDASRALELGLIDEIRPAAEDDEGPDRA